MSIITNGPTGMDCVGGSARCDSAKYASMEGKMVPRPGPTGSSSRPSRDKISVQAVTMDTTHSPRQRRRCVWECLLLLLLLLLLLPLPLPLPLLLLLLLPSPLLVTPPAPTPTPTTDPAPLLPPPLPLLLSFASGTKPPYCVLV